MTYTKWKMVRTPFINGAYVTASDTELTSFNRPLIKTGLGNKRNTFEFRVENFNGNYDNYFNVKDKITISRVVNTDTVTTSDVKMIGAIEESPYEKRGNENSLKLKGYDFSESVLSALVFIDAETKTVPEAIQAALDFVTLYNDTFNVTWNGNNPTTKSAEGGGGAFPVVGKKYFYKPLRDLIKEVSSNQYTQDGLYYYYVDQNNTLVWQKGSSYSTQTFNDTTDAFESIKVSKDTKDVVNFIILKGGTTPNGQQIQIPWPDYTSIGKNGFKFYIHVDDTKIAAELNKQDLVGVEQSARYPDLTSSYTTKWKAPTGMNSKTLGQGTVITPGSAVTINTGTEANNIKDYNQAIREVVLYYLKEKGKEIIDVRGNGKLSFAITTQAGQFNWRPGDVVSATLAMFGTTPKDLRITDVQMATDTDTYTLEEDIGTL